MPPDQRSTHRLGRRIERAASPAILAWIIFGAGVLLLAAWVVLSALMYLDQRERMPDNPAWIGPLVMGFFFLPLGLILAVKGFRGRIFRVDLHEGGVLFEERGTRIELPWEQLAGTYWQEIAHSADMGLGLELPVRRTATLRLHGALGQTIVLDERLPGHVAFARRVRDEAARAMLPRYEAALAAGQRVSFGPITFDGGALYLPQGVLPWGAVACVRWESEGALASWCILGPEGQRHAAFSTMLVPDAVVMAALLDRLGKLGENHAPSSLGAELVASVRRLFQR